MTKHLERQKLDTLAKILPKAAPQVAPAQPQVTPVEVKRTFDMPPALHLGLCGVFLTYLAVMGIGLASPGLIIPIAICVLFTVAIFAVPAFWTRMAPSSRTKMFGWAQFRHRGVMTCTGRVSAGSAMAQMYIVPGVVLAWGIAIVAIWGLSA